MAEDPRVGQDLFRVGFKIILRHTKLDKTPLDEWSVRRRDLYLKTHKAYRRTPLSPRAGFEPEIPAIEHPQTHVLDGAATGFIVKLQPCDAVDTADTNVPESKGETLVRVYKTTRRQFCVYSLPL
jgi:hypothetical protein